MPAPEKIKQDPLSTLDVQVCEATDLNLLIFEFYKVKLAVDMVQVSGLIEPDEARNRELEIVKLEDRIRFRDTFPKPRSPKCLMIRDHELRSLMIASPDDIISVDSESLRPLPFPLNGDRNEQPILAVMWEKDEAVFLLDCYQILGLA